MMFNLFKNTFSIGTRVLKKRSLQIKREFNVDHPYIVFIQCTDKVLFHGRICELKGTIVRDEL